MKKLIFGLVTILAAVLIISSCNSSKSKDELIVGTWVFNKIIKSDHSAESIASQEAEMKEARAIFEKDGNFISEKDKEKRLGKYKLIDNGTHLITNMHESTSWDTVRVVELNATTLQIEIPSKEIMELKKVN